MGRIEKEVKRVSVPLSYAGELYTLRIHIAHVQESLRKAEKVLRSGAKESLPHFGPPSDTSPGPSDG